MLEITLDYLRALIESPDALQRHLLSVCEGVDYNPKLWAAAIDSMTPAERDFPFFALESTRICRIAAGAGLSHLELIEFLEAVKQINVRFARLQLRRDGKNSTL